MDFKEKVRNVLETLDLTDLEVKFLENRGSRIVAAVISPSFDEMDEEDRQELVWGKLLDSLPDHESRRVEFVFTETPAEVAANSTEHEARP